MPLASPGRHAAAGPFYGGIDAGGTKFLCAIGSAPDRIVRIVSIETASPQQTLAAASAFFNAWLDEGKTLAGIGISCFGPLVRDRNAPDYGKLRNSPKHGWEYADVAGFIGGKVAVPLRIDTDVNGAALAEGRWGAARGKSHFAYVTAGTGIGVGIVADGRPINGAAHPELGHYRPPRHAGDTFEGICPLHGDCLEGLASGRALQARSAGRAPEELPDDAPVWQIEAHYLAHLCTVLLLALAPERIIFGGGLMRRESLFGMIRSAATAMLNGYPDHALPRGGLATVIVPSGLAFAGSGPATVNAGVLGGFILAEQVAAGA